MNIPVKLDVCASLPALDFYALERLMVALGRIVEEPDRPDRVIPASPKDILVKESWLAGAWKVLRIYYTLDLIQPSQAVRLANGDFYDGPFYHVIVGRIRFSEK
ncbi:hypothetical protein [Azospirillum thermophilum]|uniref:Uncharacterized protein n=1 Tax=Azospirillum thermophilum TaxID=2202148 RepID=A0A2S2CRY1_9PROT|nr:hypothetical protein [Azospirillum thermophilum]AWK87242.1 hypothetical protein DEW08_14355 [Azospirillum thermophilum]